MVNKGIFTSVIRRKTKSGAVQAQRAMCRSWSDGLNAGQNMYHIKAVWYAYIPMSLCKLYSSNIAKCKKSQRSDIVFSVIELKGIPLSTEWHATTQQQHPWLAPLFVTRFRDTFSAPLLCTHAAYTSVTISLLLSMSACPNYALLKSYCLCTRFSLLSKFYKMFRKTQNISHPLYQSHNFTNSRTSSIFQPAPNLRNIIDGRSACDVHHASFYFLNSFPSNQIKSHLPSSPPFPLTQ